MIGLVKSIGDYLGGMVTPVSRLVSSAFRAAPTAPLAAAIGPPRQASQPLVDYSSLGSTGSYLGQASSLAAPFASAYLSSYLDKQAFERQHQAAREAEDRAWKRDTEYNTPKAQMARLREAGLNPALLYGQGVSGASGSVHPPMAPRAAHPRTTTDMNQLGDSLSRYYSIQNQHLQNRLLLANTRTAEHELRVLRSHGLSSRDPAVARLASRFLFNS